MFFFKELTLKQLAKAIESGKITVRRTENESTDESALPPQEETGNELLIFLDE